MDQPGSGFSGRGHAADLETPLPYVGLAGGLDAVFDVLVDHELPQIGSIPTKDSFLSQAIRASTGWGKVDHGARRRSLGSAGVLDHCVSARIAHRRENLRGKLQGNPQGSWRRFNAR
jgi:hypothetical protein